MPKYLNEPVVKYGFLRLPCILCLIVSGECDEGLSALHVNGYFRDGAIFLKEIVDRFQAEVFTWYVPHDNGIIVAIAIGTIIKLFPVERSATAP